MTARIEYRGSTYNGLGRRTGTEPTSYTPILSDAIEWNATDEKFTFVLDLLDLGLRTDGDEYCTSVIQAVEDAFDALLGKDKEDQ